MEGQMKVNYRTDEWYTWWISKPLDYLEPDTILDIPDDLAKAYFDAEGEFHLIRYKIEQWLKENIKGLARDMRGLD
jgi:hypothetical protein